MRAGGVFCTGMSSDTSTLPISQIVRALSPAFADTVCARAQTQEKKTFAAFMSLVSSTLNFRPGIWQNWPKPKQREWLWANLRSSRFASTARQLLQEWYFAERVKMLNTFLDAVGIEHDENGFIKGDAPEKLDAAAVNKGVVALEVEFPAEEIALYLYLFQSGKDGGWPEVAAEIARLAPAQWQWRK
jgi:hypothetical protein